MYAKSRKGDFFLFLQSDDDSGNDSDSSERSGKRKRFDDEAIERRREKRLWEEQRYCRFNHPDRKRTLHSGKGTNVCKTKMLSILLILISIILK